MKWVWIASMIAGLAAGAAFALIVRSPFGLVAAPYVTLGLVVAAYPLRRRRGSETTEFRRDFVWPAAALLVLLAAREGAFGSLLSLDVSWFHSSLDTSWHTEDLGTARTSSAAGGGSTGIDLSVEAQGWGGGQIVGAVRERLRQERWLVDHMTLDVGVDASDSWCFMPLFKWSSKTCGLAVHAQWTGPGAGRSGETMIRIDGNVRLTVVGIAPRRRVNTLIGEALAEQVAASVRKAIARE
jgi:hypothetical protein